MPPSCRQNVNTGIKQLVSENWISSLMEIVIVEYLNRVEQTADSSWNKAT